MRIYVACPGDTVTGGIELLHQLVHELNNQGAEAYIWSVNGAVPKVYADEYQNPEGTPDAADYKIFPEIWASYANRTSGKCAVFWESVDNYFPHTSREDWFKFSDDILHISQSEYSERFLRYVLNIPDENIIHVADYVNADFLNCDISGERKQQVLYNPVKGFGFAGKLIAYMQDVCFIPITGLERDQIIKLMTESMVYVDFGNFPGRDRLPREAGACGMCLVTGRRGSAKYSEDLSIPNLYQFDDVNFSDLEDISRLIRGIMANFELHQQRFKFYRNSILQEKADFSADVKRLIKRIKA